MIDWRILSGAAWAPVLCAAAGLSGAALAQGVMKDKRGNWETRCQTPPGAQHEQCSLIQSVVAEDRPNVALTVIMLKTADGKGRIMRIVAPFGVLLPAGLGLKIDGEDFGRVGYTRCLPSGCVAEAEMDDKLLNKLKSGQSATLAIFKTPEQGIGIPLPLAGLKEGYDLLP